MTREEAIAVLVESKRQNEVMRDNPSTFWASQQMAEGVKNAQRRIAALDFALAALRPISREQVRKVWKGEWTYDKDGYLICSNCGFNPTYSQNSKDKKGLSNCRFCPNCGDAKTDEAVEMVMERLEELYD